MLRDDLIALGLHSGTKSSTSTPDGASRQFAPVERLLTILRDVIAVIELPDDGTLHSRIEDCRKAVAGAKDLETVQAAIDACADACEEALARIDRQRVEQKKEIASLLDMVQEALAIVSGDGQSFNHHLGHSMDRFEALVGSTMSAQLKSRARARSRRAARNRRRTPEGLRRHAARISITACNCSSAS